MAKLWGGRFRVGLAENAKDYSYSLQTDQFLFPYDIMLSLAHIKMLAEVGIVSVSEGKKIEKGLIKVFKKFDGQDLSPFAEDHEDVHSFIQSMLEAEIGEVAKKLHSGRSRNDQVATATRLFVSDYIEAVIELIEQMQSALIQFSEKNIDVVVPGFTHLQHAQVVLLPHHFLAYVEMLERDKERFQDIMKRVDVLPLGSGSLSGTTLPIDRNLTAKYLGFQALSQNSMDAVSDRDYIIEVLAAVSISMMHLSRLSEDMILWNSDEFKFITFSDGYTTGSSLMPNKKNPDMFELCRGKSGQAIGQLVSVLVMMKGLPLTYNRDMQEDKKPLFDGLKLICESLNLFKDMFQEAEVNKANCLLAASEDLLFATDLLDYFVMRGLAFSDAHHAVGQLILESEEKEVTLSSLPLNSFKTYCKKADENLFQIFDPIQSVKSKKSIGSTGETVVKKRLAYWKKKLTSIAS